MTDDQAQALATRIVNTMRRTPTRDEWTDTLRPLASSIALDTWRTLRTTHGDQLTITDYMAVYRRHQPTPISGGPTCRRCNATRWIEVTDDRRHAPHCHTPDTCRCTALEPCPCTRTDIP